MKQKLNFLWQGFRYFLLAWMFFTKIPLPQKFIILANYDENAERDCLAYLPMIGFVIGAISAGAFCLVFEFLQWKIGLENQASALTMISFLAAIAATMVSIICTGALHEDGLADVADALVLGAIWDKNRILGILKDPHLGVFAVLALIFGLALKIGLLTLLSIVSPILTMATLWSAHIFSRLAPVILLHTLPYVGNRAQSKSPAMMAQPVEKEILILGMIFSLLAVPILWAAVYWSNLGLNRAFLHSGIGFLFRIFLIIFFNAWILFWLQRWFQRRLGGITGDCLGAAQQIIEWGWILGVLIFII